MGCNPATAFLMIRQDRPRKTHGTVIFFILLLLFMAGCRSVPRNGSSGAVLVSKESPYPSITVETYRNESYPLIYYLVSVDLTDESLALVAAPLPAAKPAAGIVKGEKTSDFAKRTGAIIAVNATPFSIPDGKLRFLTSDRKLEGLFIAEGKQIASPVSRYAVLGFARDRRAFILESQTEPLPENTSFAFGGFWVILKNGRHTGSFRDIQDSRTAAGISAGGSTLFILAVEGERPLSSRGLSYYDCAEILLEKGAADAVELDGGSSTSLAIQGKNSLSYSETGIVANSFGFIACPPVY